MKKTSCWLLSAAIVGMARGRTCDYEQDLEVEFSECDAYGTSRNGKFQIALNLTFFILF